MKIMLSSFLGANRAKDPLDLPDGVGVQSTNQNPVRGGLRPWRAPLTVATVPGGRQTIYRMGRDVANDANYWLSWTGVVHAVRASEPDDLTERTYFTGDGPPKWTDNTKALGAPPYPVTSRLLGVPAPTNALTLAASGGASTTNETRSYTYTFVNNIGQEGAQAPVSLDLVCKTDATVTVTGIAPPPAGAYFINRVRIYRTQSGASGDVDFFFVREVAIGQTQTIDDGRLNPDTLTTSSYLMPPENLSNLTGLWNGMMAAISGNAVRFCAAYKYYAWPIENEVLPNDAKPVALAKFGEASLLVLTTGKPLLVSGGTPDALDAAPLAINEACIAPRSVVAFGHGVIWACPDGLAYYGNGRQPGIITQGLLTKDDWNAINPASIVGGAYEGAYMGIYTVGGQRRAFLLDPLNPTGIYFTDIPGEAVFFDEIQDQLYILNAGNIQRWDAGPKLTATFRSKLFRMPKPINFAAFEVVADTYPVQVRIYADGMLKHTQNVTETNSRRLPSGFTAKTWQVELSTANVLQGFQMATSVSELSQ